MDADLDPFDEFLSQKASTQARAGGKFQPRAKPRAAPKGRPAPVASVSKSINAVEKAVAPVPSASEAVQSVGNEAFTSAGSSLPNVSNIVEPGEPPKESGVLCSHEEGSPKAAIPSIGSREDRSPGNAPNSEAAASDGMRPSVEEGSLGQDSVVANEGTHSVLGKSVEENADLFSGLECIDDFVNQSASSIEVQPPASNGNETRGKSSSPAPNSVNSSVLRESGVFSHLETLDISSDATVASDKYQEWCTRKFQPRPKVQTGKENHNTTISPADAAGSVLPPADTDFVPTESPYIDEGSLPAFSSVDAPDYIPSDPTTLECPINKQQLNVDGSANFDDATISRSEDISVLPEKECSESRKRKASSGSNLSSLAGEANEGDGSSRQLRKRPAKGWHHVDNAENEANNNSGLHPEPPGNSVEDEGDNDYEYREDEDDNDDEEYRVETTSQQKSRSRKTNKTTAGKEKPVQKPKKADGAPKKSTAKRPRKFSHSTRRKKRCVREDLRNMPDDEIEYQSLPIKDIILLAEYKEKLAAKQAKELKKSSNNQSADKSLHQKDSHNEEDSIAEGEDTDYANDQTNSRAEPDIPLFNNHSFMDRERTTRWTKQDTELFYEAVRQFGSDFSMIQQLFPGRSRHQVKLKFKKEERQHRSKLYEALCTRANDHTYFEAVIEKFKQEAAAQAEQESLIDRSSGMMDEDGSEEEVAKPEQDEDVPVVYPETHVPQVHSPPKVDDEDGDDDDDDGDKNDLWSSYQSVF